MVLAIQQSMTAEQFDEYALLPENRDRLLEFIGGRVVEVVSSGLPSRIGMMIGSLITVFVLQNNLGYVTGADGGYMVSGERYIPDAAFMSTKRQQKQPDVPYNPLAPDLAVEVISHSNTDEEMRLKTVNFLNAGTTLWLFDPYDRRTEIYVPGQKPRVLLPHETLDGGAVLPGFTLPLSLIFGKEDKPEMNSLPDKK